MEYPPYLRGGLHFAIERGDQARVTELLRYGALIDERRGSFGYTPLMVALDAREYGIALQLLANGASTQGPLGAKAMELASNDDAGVVFDALLARGVPIAGSYALHRAAALDQLVGLRRLLEAGAPVNEQEPIDHMTPLFLACFHNNLEAARILLAHGASLSTRGPERNTALNWAATGARPVVIPSRGLAPPFVMLREQQPSAPLVELLLAHHASVTETDAQGNTPLHVAALSNARAAASVLLAAGANPNVKNNFGETPLSLARDHEGLERWLLDQMQR